MLRGENHPFNIKSMKVTMLTHTGKRLTIHLTEQAQDKLQMAADLVGV